VHYAPGSAWSRGVWSSSIVGGVHTGQLLLAVALVRVLLGREPGYGASHRIHFRIRRDAEGLVAS
jgi:hypothetical protein